LRVSPWLIAVMAISIVGFNLLVLRAILSVIGQPPQAGAERLIGQRGIALSDLAPDGQVRVDLEDWSAVTERGEIRAGEAVRVIGISGVHLRVEPAEESGETKEESAVTEEI
jgi:membrane-bound serine protease (ClpP class)